MTLTSSGNSSPTKDMMSDVFPTLAIGGDMKKVRQAAEKDSTAQDGLKVPSDST